MARSQGEQSELNKGHWTGEENEKLKIYMNTHDETPDWKAVAKAAGLKRSGKSCRHRWINYLRPNIKRGKISKDEHDAIIRHHSEFGSRWCLIAAKLGRTENDVKNYSYNRLKKKLALKDKVPELYTRLKKKVALLKKKVALLEKKVALKDRVPELHSDAFTLPAQTLSGLPPQGAGHFCYPATEYPQFNNNYPEVHAPSFPDGIPNALVSELCMSNYGVEKEITPAQEEIANPSFTSTPFELAQRAENLILGNETYDSLYEDLANALK